MVEAMPPGQSNYHVGSIRKREGNPKKSEEEPDVGKSFSSAGGVDFD